MSTVVSMLGGAEGRRLSPAFRSMAGRRLSPACRSMPSPLRRRQFELDKMRELARCDEFSDSESDGVDSDDEAQSEDEDFDAKETVFVPYRRPDAVSSVSAQQQQQQQQQQRAADRHAARRLHKMLATMKKAGKRQDDKAGSSPKGDEWTLVDKSPTFESVAEGKTELGDESWFVQDREQA